MNFTSSMKKKLLLILVICSLFIWVGIKIYQVAHTHAQSALMHVQSRLRQLVGANGQYSYSEAHINWFTQSVVITNVKLTFPQNIKVTMRKISAVPKDTHSVSNLNIKDLQINSPSLSASIASLAFDNLNIPAFAQSDLKTGLSWAVIRNISFEQGNIKGAYFNSEWGNLRLGSWQITRQGSAKKRPYLFYNVDVAPINKTGRSASLDALHFDQFILEMSNERKFNEIETIASFLTNTDFFFKAYGVVGYRSHQKRLSIGQLNIHLARQETVWDGEILADKFDYDLISSYSLFAEYLKRLGYTRINGAFHSNFTYYLKDSLFSLHKMNYFGYDFMGLYLQSRFYVDQKVFDPYILNWSDSVLLKAMNLSLYDAGLKNRIFLILAHNTQQTEKQVYTDTLNKFIEFSKGKDFELDRQLYTALADILQHRNHMMQLSIVFETPERVNSLLNMNFLDFFKLINQNNMTITAIPKN
ncbi:unnamed protein product [Commensalibacter communis]|uniref:Uncharacterized protein n=2 Tax=Commensalibacter communis TaxID=2972786 RepID=A0A9W4TRI4_9PROT|nr:unnamed protein product [Commensalibacter communis]CAI3944994.1 unnamed protein product [Commensalibacter communis]CAI3959954.1 unnamed protein product [Commensalibacter communis]